MNIEFERKDGELILILAPERIYTAEILDALNTKGKWVISRSFTVTKQNFRSEDAEQNELRFCIGTVYDEYTLIDNNVVETTHNFYFSNTIKLKKQYFVAYRNISILSKIDNEVDNDVYIGGNNQSGYIPFETFNFLIKKFPKTAELDYYAHARIATIVKEFFPCAEEHEVRFDQFLKKQDRSLAITFSANHQTLLQENAAIELLQFSNIRNWLSNLLNQEQTISEQIWQEQIHGVLRLLYPKYLAGIREVVIKGVDRHDKRPDFFLVDANGYIDILEIKKPSIQLLTKQSSYRNNYVPVRELAGAIQQVEKYVYCLNTWGREGEQELQKQLSYKLPESITLKIVNPQGILLLGRSKDFTFQQRTDFELIKRQYKHIAEILTYDDLMQRIDNIISALSEETSIK